MNRTKEKYINLNLDSEPVYTEEEKKCIEDTCDHINKVRMNVGQIVGNLKQRASVHDASKLKEPELSAFAHYGPKLKSSTYGSDEYMKRLDEEKFRAGLNHHYTNNTHHPEHYPNGIDGMSLLDILEMMADWKAACERHDDGNLADSFEINRKRFNIPDVLYNQMVKTAKELGWL